MGRQLEISAQSFAKCAHRPQTATDHARGLAAALGLRPAAAVDLPLMAEVAAEAARGTDEGGPIAAAVAETLRRSCIILPAAAVIERVAMTGRADATPSSSPPSSTSRPG